MFHTALTLLQKKKLCLSNPDAPIIGFFFFLNDLGLGTKEKENTLEI